MQNVTAADRMNLLYLEFERLAHRVEHSSTHYQVLGIDNDANLEDIKHAYRKSVGLIRPFYSRSSQAKEVNSQERAARVLRKTSAAFSVLSHLGKKVEYDNLLFRKRPGLVPISIPFRGDREDEALVRSIEDLAPPMDAPELSELIDMPEEQLVQAVSGFQQDIDATAVATAEYQRILGGSAHNRRRHERFKIAIPVTIVGHDRFQGKWDKVVETIDVSLTGAQLQGQISLRHGSVVQLSLPLPSALRSHGLYDPTYNVYAIARRVVPVEDGLRTVGVEFLGQNPPAGYEDRPWATFRTDAWKGPERRREAREQRSEVVSIKYLNEIQQPLRQEVALTENISPSGAMIYVKAAPPDIEFIRLADLTHSFESVARICDRYIGNDGMERICLQFLDRKWLFDRAAAAQVIRG